MKTLTKFMIKSFIGPIVMTFFIVTFILMLNFLWLYIDEIVGKGLPASVIGELIFYATGTLIPIGLPLATLLAAIMTMGNLGENYELLALKAAGISLQRIVRPILQVALLIAIGSFFVINNFVPHSYTMMSTLLTDVRNQKQQIEFKDGIFFNGIPNISIKVDKQNKESHLLTGVLIYDNRNSNQSNTIVADSGYISLDSNKEFLQITLFNGHTYEENRSHKWYPEYNYRAHKFDYQKLLIPLDGFAFKRTDDDEKANDNANSRNIKQLSHDIDSLDNETVKKVTNFSHTVTRKFLFNKDTSLLITEDSLKVTKVKSLTRANISFDTLDISRKSEIIDKAMANLRSLKYYASGEHGNVRISAVNLYKSQISWYEKITLPFSILIFFTIGVSLGAIIRKGGLGTPIVISVAFFVIYYILTITGKKMVLDGAWSPMLGMWLSSIVLGPLAIFLSLQATSDSPLLNAESYTMKIKSAVEWVKAKTAHFRKR